MQPNMEQPKQYTPEEIAQLEKSRTISDAELLEDGAEYTVSKDGEKRLHFTADQYLRDIDIENIKNFDQLSQILEEALKEKGVRDNKGYSKNRLRPAGSPWEFIDFKLSREIGRFSDEYPIIGISWLGKTEDDRKIKEILENDKKRFYKVDCGDGCCTSFVLRRDYWGDDKGRNIIEEIKQNNVKV